MAAKTSPLPPIRRSLRFAAMLAAAVLVAALGYFLWRPSEDYLPAAASSPPPTLSASPTKAPTASPSPKPTPTGLLSDGKIDINRADKKTLMTLPGVGEKRAQAILDEREAGGPFADTAALSRVEGLPSKVIEEIQGLIVAGE